MEMCGFKEFGGLKTIAIGTVTNGPFLQGEVITGGGSGVGVCVKSVDTGDTMYITESAGFASAEVITGASSGATATAAGNLCSNRRTGDILQDRLQTLMTPRLLTT